MSISVSVDTTKLDEIIAKLPGNRDKIIRQPLRIFLVKPANARRSKQVHCEITVRW